MLKQSAFVLHSQPFKNSSAIIDFWTAQEGLVSAVGRGVKRPKSRQRAFLQPFIPLEMSYTGRGELKTLTHVDALSTLPVLSGPQILLGLYLNELILKLVQRYDPHPDLFEDYHQTLKKIGYTQDTLVQQSALRVFECKLVTEMGYAINLKRDAKQDLPIESDLIYTYDPSIGLYELEQSRDEKTFSISGASIQALERGLFENKTVLNEAKKLMRLVLSYHLGQKSIESRKLFGSALS